MTVEEALAHPTWKMGPMNTLNSSTLMNKGLEVIEAHLLFGAPYDQIDVVVHPAIRGPLNGGDDRRCGPGPAVYAGYATTHWLCLLVP